VVITFPTVGSGPAEWRLRESKVAEYAEAFPGVDVLVQCRKALQWIRDNPTKRKTARGMTSFLGRWLGREQDRGPKAEGNGYRNGHVGPPAESPADKAARITRERVEADRAERESRERGGLKPVAKILRASRGAKK
jgi:hypothetical protein